VENLTNIQFDEEELHLLKNGLNYSIEKSTASYFTHLIAETERAIKLLDVKLQNTYRYLETNKLKQIDMAANYNTAQIRKLYVIKKLNHKLKTGNAIIKQADKGTTIVIISSEEYTNKIMSFLATNNFKTLNKNPTDRF
jgi:hypothetical protein